MDKQQEEHVQHVFDSFCKRTLRNAANDHYDKVGRRRKHEILIDECWNLPCTTDHYALESTVYHVLGDDILLTDPSIIGALNSLSEEGRVIVLAACVSELPDRAIAEHLHMVRRTLTYRKGKLLQELRRLLSDG